MLAICLDHRHIETTNQLPLTPWVPNPPLASAAYESSRNQGTPKVAENKGFGLALRFVKINKFLLLRLPLGDPHPEYRLLRLQLGKPLQQQAYNGQGLRRLLGADFFRGNAFHAPYCAIQRAALSKSFLKDNQENAPRL